MSCRTATCCCSASTCEARAAGLGVIIAAFGFGAASHASDFVRYGWWPYRFGPPALNLFWNILVLLDAAVMLFLACGWRRAGLTSGLLVMLIDVSANSYAWRWLRIGAFATAVPMQAAFLGFLLDAAGLLWPRSTTRS